MPLSPFGNNRQFQTRVGVQAILKDVTLRDFSAGLNVVDSDTALQTNWSKVLVNMQRDTDGGMALRFGTKFKTDISSTVTGNILDIVYFQSYVLLFTSTGEIARYNTSTGSVTAIWNNAIAATLPGAPSGWSSTVEAIDTTDFKSQLIVCNGIDKPLIIDKDLTVDYLQDIPTGSNVNTPIGYYCTTVGNYVVIAGVDADPNSIYISAASASGTWQGDPPPNDATSLNVATYAPQGNSDIRGLSSFRNFLIVHFDGLSVPIQLGTYSGTDHSPTIGDVIPDYGLATNRFSVVLAQEMVFGDTRGVYVAKRNLFGGAMEASLLSQKITPIYATALVFGEQYPVLANENGIVLTNENDEALADTLTADTVTALRFAVYNKLEQRIYFFVNVGIQKQVFVYSFIDGMKRGSWSIYNDMDFDCGCTDTAGRVFFGRGTQLYQYGNSVYEDEAFYADEIDGYDTVWATATGYVVGTRVLNAGVVYECAVAHTSGTFATDLAAAKWIAFTGYPIAFDWEFPWSDANSRMMVKRLTHVHFDVSGGAKFTASMFVDKVYKDANDAYDPALSLEFAAPDNVDANRRETADQRLWRYPVEFSLFKLRIHGEASSKLRFETISLLYHKAKLGR